MRIVHDFMLIKYYEKDEYKHIVVQSVYGDTWDITSNNLPNIDGKVSNMLCKHRGMYLLTQEDKSIYTGNLDYNLDLLHTAIYRMTGYRAYGNYIIRFNLLNAVINNDGRVLKIENYTDEQLRKLEYFNLYRHNSI